MNPYMGLEDVYTRGHMFDLQTRHSVELRF